MALGEDLLKKLRKKFEPATMIQFRYRTNDISIQTDNEGNAVKMFIGKMKEDGMIRGDRYVRNIIKDREGRVIKDHWDRKGSSS